MSALAKLMFAVRAKPGLTRAQALAHLGERHGPLVAASHTNRRRLRTYVQNPAFDLAGLPAQTIDRDWIIESWRDLSVVLPEPPTAPDAVLLREDEARFPDRATLLTLQVEEAPVWVRDPRAAFAAAPVKIFSYARRPASGDRDAFDAAWAEAAARLAATDVFRRGAESWIRNLPVPGEGAPATVASAPSAAKTPPYDAVDVWRFGDVAAVDRLFADDGFRAGLARYVDLFDPAGLFRLAVRERVVFDDAGIDPGGRDAA